MSYNVQHWGGFDPSERSITVSQGGSGLGGAIKARLRNAGWTLVVDRGPVVTRGSLGENTDIATSGTYRSRYRLNVAVLAAEPAITGDTVYRYDVSIVDNREGAEVLTMNGRGLGHEIVRRLMTAINENTHN